MKTLYPIDPSLDIAIPDVLPIYQKSGLLKYINFVLKIHNRFYRWTHRTDVRIKDIYVPDNKRRIPALLFTPAGSKRDAPLLVYYHGGGFAISYAPLHIRACEHYARAAQCKILFVDYRLSPGHGWPQGFDDCFRALEWAIQNPSALGVDPQKIMVGGDSAGGALAAGVAQKARDKNMALKGQLLIYPMLDHRGITPSAVAYKDTPVWNSKINRMAWDLYLNPHDRENLPAYVAPGLCHALKGLPSAYVETAEFDPLHDEGVDYAHALKQAGVPVELHETKGTFHGFEMVEKSPLVAVSLQRRADFLKNVLKSA